VTAAGRLRVIAGTARGRRLVAPAGDAVRPTTDRVREALFSALGDRVDGARVLDLYAGSGALAIEALSRGGDHAVLVERDRDAIDAVRQNLAATGFDDRARVERADVARFVARGTPAEPFSLVLIDPPYDEPAAAVAGVLAALAEPGWLGPGATVVLERAARSEPVGFPTSWRTGWQRTYGGTLVTVASAD